MAIKHKGIKLVLLGYTSICILAANIEFIDGLVDVVTNIIVGILLLIGGIIIYLIVFGKEDKDHENITKQIEKNFKASEKNQKGNPGRNNHKNRHK